MPDENDKEDEKKEGEGGDAPAAEQENVQDIASRVAALDEGDDLEKLAREEEAKLAARKQNKRGGKKRGHEASASKRLAKIGEKTKPKRVMPDAVEAADPLIEQTIRLRDWARKNKSLMQGLVVAAIGAVIAAGVYFYMDQKKANAASDALAAAVADQRGEIGDPDKDDDTPHDKVPIFRTADERRDAALAKYRDVEAKYKGTGAAWLAKLGEGALLLDKRDADGAIADFEEVAGSSLARADAEVKGRALENLGYAYELRAELHPEQRDKNLDDAIAQYKQLESNDVFGFKQMALYDQARCYELKGDKAKAVELLKGLRDDMMKSPDQRLFGELREVADDRLRRLDPSAVPPKRKGINSAGQLSPELLEQLPPELRERFKNGG